MKKRWIFIVIFLLSIFILASCGNSKYSEMIEKVFKNSNSLVWSKEEKRQMKREKSEVRVFDKGKYIEIDFSGKDYENKPITYKRYFKSNSKQEYERADFDTKNYIKEDAKLVYHEKNGEQVKE
ncbi:cystatin-like fold lipoprotein [Listeria grayi]|nr:cystatin-like fold lipoprotein [Listeria grayi]